MRTRILVAADAENRNYARWVTEDLILALCLDYPTSVQSVLDGNLADLPLPADELFHYGQINTDAEPIDDVQREGNLFVVSGTSLVIASKITNIPELLRQLGVEAPDGLLFGIPNRSILVCAVPEAETAIGRVIEVANMVEALTPDADFDPAGGLLSNQVYYWAPTGIIEPVTGGKEETLRSGTFTPEQAADLAKESMMVIKPRHEFSSRFFKDD